MDYSMTTLSALPSATHTATAQPNPLFDLNMGMITPRFQHQMNLVGIVAKQHFPAYDAYHVKNVCKELQDRFFQKNCDFYKEGNTSTFTISYEQAVAFLNDDYSDREMIMPREKQKADGLFPCGVEATMHKRFHSLAESLKQGSQYRTIHFIAKDEADKLAVKNLINGQYKELLQGITTNIVIAETNLNIFEAGLAKLASSSSLEQEYIIITDPTFASKVEMIATSKLKEQKCLGIASAPVKSWEVDMNLYGYEKALGSHEKAAVAWALSAWNFKARDTHAALTAYEKNQIA